MWLVLCSGQCAGIVIEELLWGDLVVRVRCVLGICVLGRRVFELWRGTSSLCLSFPFHCHQGQGLLGKGRWDVYMI